MILHGDSLELLKTLDENSVDAVVTDPPYGLSFMGKKWDYDVPSVALWREVFRVLKPANEPIVLARKPLSERTVALNVLKWGTGALNIEGSRIGTSKRHPGNYTATNDKRTSQEFGAIDRSQFDAAQGRWPANLLLDEEAAAMLDEQSIAGGIHSAGKARARQEHTGDFGISQHGERTRMADHRFDDKTIGASRFFYVAKASKRERNAGLEGMPLVEGKTMGERAPDKSGNSNNTTGQVPAKNQNFHPTVKPIKLMEYLVTLITPPGGLVLDPFMGSGSTGVAARSLGFEFVGIERESEYVEIARKRIEHVREVSA